MSAGRPPAPDRGSTPYVVIGTARTGTSLVCSLLESHPAVTSPGEIFVLGRGRFPVFERKGLGMRETYVKWLRAHPVEQLRHALAASRPRAVEAFLQHFYSGAGRPASEWMGSPRPEACSARGFKLLLTQTMQLPAIVPWLQAHNVKVIRVARRNLLKTFVSREVKRRTRRATAREAVPVTKVAIDLEAMPGRLTWMDQEQAGADALLAGQPSLRLEYEALKADPVAAGRSMLEFLGVDAGAALSTPYVKTNPDRLSAVVENYAAMARALEGTHWEHFLDAEPGGAPA